MNFVFISPYFPSYFEKFCERLASKGVTVLGIGDAEYGTLTEKLRGALTEYYRVENMENYDEMLRACGYFIHKYGRLDYIESLNEYWLITEARLRTDFNVKGKKYPDVLEFRQKSAMKKYYKEAGIPSARYIFASDFSEAVKFVKKVGYPVVAKPDKGMGAADTFRIATEEELRDFFNKNYHGYLLEEYIEGDIITLEGITSSDCRLLFYSSHIMLDKLMDAVNEDRHIAFYGETNIDPKLKEMGRKLAEAYKTKNCFFHFEFFRLTEDKKGIGRKGDIIGLEVNMRPPGGLITEVISHTYDIDIYDAWANVIAFDSIPGHIHAQRYVGYASRKYRINYKHSNEDIYRSYGSNIIMKYEIEPVFRRAMGDYTYIIRASSADEIKDIIRYIQEEVHA